MTKIHFLLGGAYHMGALAQEPVKLLFCRPWQEKRGAFLLWIALEYTHPGPDGESFASSVLCHAFQDEKPLLPGLVSGQPLFCAKTAFRPLEKGEKVHIHLSYQLLEPEHPVELKICAFTPLSPPRWQCRFVLSPPWTTL